MPTRVWRYLIALLYDRTSATGVALAEVLHTVSHDRLTCMLQAAWSGQSLLESAVRVLFVWERGHRILDDTVVPKPCATATVWAAAATATSRAPPAGASDGGTRACCRPQ